MNSRDVCAIPFTFVGFMHPSTFLSLVAITLALGIKLASCGLEESSTPMSIQPAARLSVWIIVTPDLMFFAGSAEAWPVQKIISAKTK